MKANRKELAILRGKRKPSDLAEWAKAFGAENKEVAEQYALAVATFLGGKGDSEWSDYLGQLSPNTRKAYAFALAEFFEWVSSKHDRVVPPHLVTRLDAEDYVQWLANRPYPLAEEKLKDGDMPELLSIYEIVKAKGAVNLTQIIKELPEEYFRERFGQKELSHLLDRSDRKWTSVDPEELKAYLRDKRKFEKDVSADPSAFNPLDKYSQMLVLRYARVAFSKVVRQLVTMDVVRAVPTLEEIRKDHPQAGITKDIILGKPMEDIFTYSVKQYAPVSRTTVALRLAALSTFWKTLMQGENAVARAPLIQHDIWEGVKKRVSRGLTQEKRKASRQQKVPTEVVVQMLRDAPSDSVVQLRDKAILYLMVFTGLRTTEVLQLRRANTGDKRLPYFDGSEPPALQVLRKGNKWMRIPYPPAALKVLIEFQAALDKNSPAEMKGSLQLPDAPLFPSLAFWGKNYRGESDYRKSMSRINLYKLLQKVAREVGVPEEEVKHVHPHAIRHFAASAMVAGGKNMRDVQYILGHSSILTTEGYLEDVDDAVRLSGQAEILDFLESQGVMVPSAPSEKQEKPASPVEIIDTYAEEAEPSEEEEEPEVPDVSEVEVVVLGNLEPRQIETELPVMPEYEAPEVSVVDTEAGPVLVVEPPAGPEVSKPLVALDAREEETERLLDDVSRAMLNGVSSGSPDWVYEALASQSDYEPVEFQRKKSPPFISEHYPKMPENFGVGKESLLPWMIRAKGNVNKAGFYKGVPPFPVWSPEQATPETKLGSEMIQKVEQLYRKFMDGEPEKGIAPSPIHSAGLIQWFGFFVFHAKSFEAAHEGFFSQDTPDWGSFEEPVPLGDLRTHKSKWLVGWLRDNSHTYRASAEAMTRGVPRGSVRGKELDVLGGEYRDMESYFLRAAFKGIDIVTKMPEWIVEDDPINAMYRDNPSEYREFVKWIRNVTGQALTSDRVESREDQKQSVEEAQLEKANTLTGLLSLAFESRDEMEKAEKTGDIGVAQTARSQYREMLIGFLIRASDNDASLTQAKLESMREQDSRKFIDEFEKLCEEYNVPYPNAEKYRKVRGVKQRIEKIVRDAMPQGDVLEDANMFADSKLFDPRWFRVDTKKHTIVIEEKAARELADAYGLRQNVQLLVRRAARAMYENRTRGYEKLWGVMLSYFVTILPSGAEMESMVKGIPVAEGVGVIADREARKAWLRDWSNDVAALARGESLKSALKDTKPGKSKEVHDAELQALIEEQSKERGTERRRYGDAMDYLKATQDGFDVSAMASSMGWSAPGADELLMELESQDFSDTEDEGSYFPNRRRAGLTKNGRNVYLHLEGEKPQGWYAVDFFSSPTEFTPNSSTTIFLSPGVLYAGQKKIEKARLLLPSPFRMIAAMSLE